MRDLSGYRLNTSNPDKYMAFVRMGLRVPRSAVDLPEVKSDPVSVIVHKAKMAGERVIVEDTSLDVKGARVGVDVRWMLSKLDKFVGREAKVRVLIGVMERGNVLIYGGLVKGRIVPPRGVGWGFDPVFEPDASSFTLAEKKSRWVDARYRAVRAFLRGRPSKVVKVPGEWEGDWQG